MMDEQYQEEKEPFLDSPTAKHSSFLDSVLKSKSIVVGQWIIIVILVALAAAGWQSMPSSKHVCQPPNRVYSIVKKVNTAPAEHLIRYKNMNFMGGSGPQVTEYQGPPGPANDEIWEDLYRYAINRIPKESARQLNNKTVPIPGDPGQYIIGLDVFHQLHSPPHEVPGWKGSRSHILYKRRLQDIDSFSNSHANQDAIRKRVWSESLAEEEENEIKHIDHCIDSVRQSLMCSSDISPIVWNWDPEVNFSRPIATIFHTCRDFDALRQWAEAHHLERFESDVYVEDDL